MQSQGLAVDLVIDRATAARFGITPASVDNALYDAFGQRIISTIYTQSNQYRVILEADPALQRTLVQSVLVLSCRRRPPPPMGKFHSPRSSTLQQRLGPLLITHLGQFPATTISFNVAPGASLGAAVAAIDKAEQDIDLPESFVTSFQGAAAAFRASTTNELFLIIAAVITMYIVLGVLYESFIHPITILSTLPSAGVGALLALMVSGHELDVIAIIGIILADRHRQEECDHDDRFRSRGRTLGRTGAARRHLPGLSFAVSPDPDDDFRRDPRRPALDAWDRHRLGAPQSAGHRHRRRPRS